MRRNMKSWGGGAWVLSALLGLAMLSCSKDEPAFAPFAQEPGMFVTGMVRVDGAGPAAGVAVTLEPLQGGMLLSVRRALGPEAGGADPATEKVVEAATRVTTTDGAGRFVFAQVAAGSYQVSSMARNHLAGSRQIEVSALLNPMAADTTHVDIALVPTGTLTGSVLLENGADHLGTVVFVEGESNVAVTTSLGRFILRNVPVGSHTVYAMREQWQRAFVTGSLAAAGDSVELAPMVLHRDSNIRPTVTASAAASGNVFAPFLLDATASDADGSVVLYEWDFEDDGTFDYASPTSAATTHLYDDAGVHRAKIRVSDNAGDVEYAVVSFRIWDGYYVATDGSDTNLGTKDLPYRTIQHGLDAAEANGDLPVFVALGTYAESLDLPDGCDLRGGYDRVTWIPSGLHSVNQTSHTPMTAIGLSDCRVSFIEVQAADAVSGSSIALVIDACPGPNVEFADCRFVSGNGAAGARGVDGSDGAAGQAGISGGQAGDPGQAPWGGSGGAGGYCGTFGCGPVAGSNGDAGPPLLGGTGGTGTLGTGGNGGPGATYPQMGSSGIAGAVGGSWIGYAWSANQGGNGGQGGQGGSGGGGGGGGGTWGSRGGGGGSGGQGGYGGTGAGGGLGAGGSFAVLVAGNSNPRLTRCLIDPASGGVGGNGGDGGLRGVGGIGGSRGWGPNDTYGGDGGAGGNGTPGGGGAGGGGGWSVGLYIRSGSTCDYSTCTFGNGGYGRGGRGGLRGGTLTRAPDGPDGRDHEVFSGP